MVLVTAADDRSLAIKCWYGFCANLFGVYCATRRWVSGMGIGDGYRAERQGMATVARIGARGRVGSAEPEETGISLFTRCMTRMRGVDRERRAR
jgi:hypothetical protein